MSDVNYPKGLYLTDSELLQIKNAIVSLYAEQKITEAEYNEMIWRYEMSLKNIGTQADADLLNYRVKPDGTSVLETKQDTLRRISMRYVVIRCVLWVIIFALIIALLWYLKQGNIKIMPFPLAAVGGIIGSGISYLTGRRTQRRNEAMQREQNMSDRMYQNEVYSNQRRDALADWEMMNKYNSPMQQRQRMREAGFNEYLMYGQGPQNTGAMIRSSSPVSSKQEAPRWSDDNLGPLIGQGFNVVNSVYQGRQIQAQTDNLRAQNEVLQQEALLKAAQTYETTNKGKNSEFDLLMKENLQDLVKRQAELGNMKLEEEIRNIGANTLKTLTDEEVSRLRASNDRIKTAWEIIELKNKNNLDKQQLDNLRQDYWSKVTENDIKQIELSLRQQGMSPTDPLYWRQFFILLQKLYD